MDVQPAVFWFFLLPIVTLAPAEDIGTKNLPLLNKNEFGFKYYVRSSVYRLDWLTK